ncbi:MAG: membrane protein insertase YidC [Nitrospira sp.]|nr:membrane protein insertase YidC [Nitrospira sp.]
MDKRTLLALGLSMLVLIGWSFFQGDNKGIAPVQPVVSETAETMRPANPVSALPLQQAAGQADVPALFANAGNDVIVETDLVKAVFTTQGATLKYFKLKGYNPDGTDVVLLEEQGVVPSLGIILDGPDKNLPQKLVFEVNTEKLTLSSSGRKTGELVFSYNNQGVKLIKKFLFYNDDYKIDIVVDAANIPNFSIPLGTDFGISNKSSSQHVGPLYLTDTDREEFDEDLTESETFTGNIKWIAQEDAYFAAALIPLTSFPEGVKVWKDEKSAEIAIKLTPAKHEFTLYAGPKEYDRLEAMGHGLEYLVNFGFFTVVALPLFLLLKFFYSYLGNYGWAIIVLTIVVRIPFIPILHKSQKSMKKMTKIQPLMAELKVKYKDDAAKLQKEMMGIYKKHKVNPIGGCLPMFLQVPVFIALFAMLQTAIELRGAPFMFWITDLASADPIYVLPITMGLTMLIQQKMTPTTMDPKQAKMMLMMPIVFTFMFLSFSSGLVLYWLVNNILGIIQQHFVNKQPD